MRWIVLAFVVIPLVELYLLVWLSTFIGFFTTVAITLITGVAGGTLAKREGLRVWRSYQAALDRMQPPEHGVIDGLLILLGGALLITPGVLTDVVGFGLLLPPSRRRIAARVRRAVEQRIARTQIYVASTHPHGGTHPYGDARRRRPNVIETEASNSADTPTKSGSGGSD